MSPGLVNNEKEMQFEFSSEGEKATLQYRYSGSNLVLMHTYVPVTLEGKGIAGSLATEAFRFAATYKLPVVVYCPYVTRFLIKHPEYLPQLVQRVV